ncbi:MAG: YraN family protein [Bacteroidota bacterium]|nr:YraN family protein [Bacteroidota bacterium]
MNSKEFGNLGEEMARDFLASRGYKILDKNWLFKKKELDLVVMCDEYLVFVEVKTRMDTTLEDPTRAITKAKKRNLIEAANAYIREYDIDLEARFDVITVLLDKHGAPTLQHYESAILPEL